MAEPIKLNPAQQDKLQTLVNQIGPQKGHEGRYNPENDSNIDGLANEISKITKSDAGGVRNSILGRITQQGVEGFKKTAITDIDDIATGRAKTIQYNGRSSSSSSSVNSPANSSPQTQTSSLDLSNDATAKLADAIKGLQGSRGSLSGEIPNTIDSIQKQTVTNGASRGGAALMV